MANDLVALESALLPLSDKFSEALQVPGVALTAQRLIRSILISCERTPRVMQCSRQSLFNSAMSAACLGLEVDGVTGQAFLVPFDVRGQLTAQLIIGYKGYNTLAARSGITITAEVVRDGDAFDFDEGEGWVKHRKILGQPGRRIIAVWARAAAVQRPAVVKVLDIEDILAIKRRSPAARKNDSPWNDEAIGFPAMAEKTAKRRLARSMPLNIVQLAARLDEAVEEQGRVAHITPSHGLVIDQEPVEAAAVTPAIAPRADEQPTLSARLHDYDRQLAAAAAEGMTALETCWKGLPNECRIYLKSALETRYKPTATQKDSK